MLGLIGLANQSSLQWKITMKERHLCWPPYFFHGPAVPPTFFILESPLKRQLVIHLPGSFILARIVGQFIVCLKLLSKWELSIGLNFKFNVLYKSIASKNIQSDMNYVLKNLSCIGQLGVLTTSKARANEVVRTPAANDIV